jgi:hypothetical protein
VQALTVFENKQSAISIQPIQALKRGAVGLRPLGHRSVEWQFAFCLQQNATPGWGLAEGHKQRVAKEIAKIAEIAKIGN